VIGLRLAPFEHLFAHRSVRVIGALQPLEQGDEAIERLVIQDRRQVGAHRSRFSSSRARFSSSRARRASVARVGASARRESGARGRLRRARGVRGLDVV
jgi:hypothetical protein